MNQPDFEAFFTALSSAQKKQYIQEVAKAKAKKEAQDENNRYLSENGIIDFVQTRLGATPKPYQERILRALVKHKRVAVRSPHGAGKTTIAAWFTLWLMECYDDVKIPTLAPTDRQAGFLWSEIRKWAKHLDKPSFRVLQRRLDGGNKEAFSVSSDDAALIEGVHASAVAYVFDESKAIADPFFDAAEGAFSNADTEGFTGYWLVISTPGNPSGMFYDIHSHKAGLTDWHAIHVTIDECVQAGKIHQSWVDKRKLQWGENSPVYRNRVLAEFDESGEDSVIPLSWAEKAIERAHSLMKEPEYREAGQSYGCDPARYGTDKTAIAHRKGRVITRVTYHALQDTMQTAGRVASLLQAAGNKTPCAIDTIGIGAGVYDRLKEQKFNVHPVNVSERALDKHGKPLTDVTGTLQFVNLRSWLWWHLRDLLNPDNPDAIGLPDDDLLIGDLCAAMFSYTSARGLIQVESKDDVRKRLKRSTDGADAVALALLMDAPHMNAPNLRVYRMA